MNQLTKEQAIEMAKSGIWKSWTDKDIVKFQLYQRRLCMDFSRYQKAVRNVFGRSVFTHEFSNMKALQSEYEGKNPPPTWEEIVNLLPKGTTVVIIGE